MPRTGSVRRTLILVAVGYGLEAGLYAQVAPVRFVQPKVVFKDIESVLHINIGPQLPMPPYQVRLLCKSCPSSTFSDPFPARKSPALQPTTTLLAVLPRAVTNDLPLGDYIVELNGTAYSGLVITIRSTPFWPQIQPGSTPTGGNRDQFVNPDDDLTTNDQLYDGDINLFAWGLGPYYATMGGGKGQRWTKEEAKSNWLDPQHAATKPLDDVALIEIGTTQYIKPHWPFLFPHWYDNRTHSRIPFDPCPTLPADLCSNRGPIGCADDKGDYDVADTPMGACPIPPDPPPTVRYCYPENCTGDPAIDGPGCLNSPCFGTWSVFRNLLDDYCDAPDCTRTPVSKTMICSTPLPNSELCTFRALTNQGPLLDYRAESIFIDPTGGGAHKIVPRGQDENDLGHTDPNYYLDWANPFAVNALGKRFNQRVGYWNDDANLDPTYGSSQIDIWSAHEYALQKSMFFDYVDGSGKVVNRYTGGLGNLYYNSPTYSDLDAQSFTAYVVATCAANPQLCPAGSLPSRNTPSAGCSETPNLNYYRFPLLAGDFNCDTTDPARKMIERCVVWNPNLSPQDKYWDLWVAWRYQDVAKGYAEIAKQIRQTTENPLDPGQEKSRIKFMYFGPAGDFNDLLRQVTNSGIPLGRRWWYRQNEDAMPSATTMSPCRNTVYVDEGTDLVVWEKAFRDVGVDLEFLTGEGASRPGADWEARTLNTINRDRGESSGNARYARMKGAAFFRPFPGAKPPSTFTSPLVKPDPQEEADAIASTSDCVLGPFNISYARNTVAQVKNAGLDYVSAFPASYMIIGPPKCSEATRTPFFDMWRTMREGLTDEAVWSRTINANLLRNGSFEDFRSKGQVNQFFVADYWSRTAPLKITLYTAPPSQSTSLPFQGERYLSLDSTASQVTAQSEKVLLDPARVYKLQAWVRAPGAPGKVTVRVQFYDRNENPVSQGYQSCAGASCPVALDDQWRRVVVANIIPPQPTPGQPDDRYAEVLLVANYPGGGVVNVDNVWLWDDSDDSSLDLDQANYVENPSMEARVPGSPGAPESWTSSVLAGTGANLDIVTDPNGAAPYEAEMPPPLGSYLRISVPAGPNEKAAWVSDRLFADTTETYTDVGVLVKGNVIPNGSSAHAELRWYKEGQDFEEFLSTIPIGNAVTTSGPWLKEAVNYNPMTCRSNPASCIQPHKDAVFARIYLILEGHNLSQGSSAYFDSVRMHGLGPLGDPPPPYCCTLPCGAGGPLPPTAGFTLSPNSGPEPLAVKTTNTTQGYANSFSWVVNGPGSQVIKSTADAPEFLLTQGSWAVSMTACAGPLCDSFGPVSVSVGPGIFSTPTLDADGLSSQAADPSTYETFEALGTSFQSLPFVSQVRFCRDCGFPYFEFPAISSNVRSSTRIVVTSPKDAGGKSAEDDGPTSRIWVRNHANPYIDSQPPVPFAFTYRPRISASQSPQTLEMGSVVTIKGFSFIEDRNLDGASVLFEQGTKVVEIASRAVRCGGTGSRCPEDTEVDIVVPNSLVPGAATMSVRKLRSFGLKDKRVSKPVAVTIQDTTPPVIVDAYPPGQDDPLGNCGATWCGASPNTEISVTVADAGVGLQNSGLTLKVKGISIATFDVLPKAAIASSYTLRYTPASGFALGDNVTVEVGLRDGAGNNTSVSYSFNVTNGVDGLDFDGLPTDWEDAHFNDDGFSGKYDDTDSDVIAHFKEYAGGSNPDSYHRIITAPGPVPENPSQVLLYTPFAPPGSQTALWNGFKPSANSIDFFAYGTPGFGANVGAADVDIDHADEVLTGPGPGDTYGPQVRAFEVTWQPRNKVNFFAYGTLKYGVRVAGGDIDGMWDELLTAPGSGAAFGPHIRGWKAEGSAATAMPKVSFMAYSTQKWGAYVDRGDVDGDGFDEIVTGPGPGELFGATVKGFNFDGNVVALIGGISFGAYPTLYGVRVAGGDIDGDRYDEIVSGPGPDPNADSRVKTWNFDASSISLKHSFVAFALGDRYGVGVASGGDLDPTGSSLAYNGLGDDILAFQGAPRQDSLASDPGYLSQVKAYKVAGSAVALRNELTAFDVSGLRGGVNAALGHFDGPNAYPASTPATTEQLRTLLTLLSGTPDSRTIDYSLDPNAGISINEWSNDALKDAAVADLAYLDGNLADLNVTTIISKLSDARIQILAGLLNDMARGDILADLDALLTLYQSGEICSGAVVARIPLADVSSIVALESSAMVPNTAFVATTSGDSSTIALVPDSSLQASEQTTIEGTLQDLDVSLADGALVGVRCPNQTGGCPTGQLGSAIVRQPLGRVLGSGLEAQLLPSGVWTPDLRVGLPSPPWPKGPARAVAHTAGSGSPTALTLLRDLGLVPGSPEEMLPHGTPNYDELAGSPIAGDPRVFAIHHNGVDTIDLEQGVIHELAIAGFGGNHVRTVRLDSGKDILVTLDDTSGVITFYDLDTNTVASQVVEAGAIGITPIPGVGDTLVLKGSSITILDGSGSVRKIVPICPGATRFTLTADGTRALVTNSSSGTMDIVLVAPEDLSRIAQGAARVFEAQPDATFSIGQAVFGCQSFSGSGQSTVTSSGFDSVVGHVTVNGSLDLSGNARVEGDVRLGPGGTSKVSGNAVVTGTITKATDDFGCGPIDLPSARSRITSRNDNTQVPLTTAGRSVWATSASTGDFVVHDGDTATLPPGTYFMSMLQVSKASKVEVTGPVTIFLSGLLDVSGQSQILAQPGPLLLLSDATGKHKVTSSAVEMLFYSPSASLEASGGGANASFHGAVWASDVKVSGQFVVQRTHSLEAGALREWFAGELRRIASDIGSALLETDPASRDQSLDVLIGELRELVNRMDASFGGDPADDWIGDVDRQQVLVPVLEDLIRRLEGEYLVIPGPPPVVQ